MTPEAIELKIKPRNLPARESTQLSKEALLVRNALLQQGLETPMIDNGLSPQQKYDRIRELMTDVISTLGLDLTDDSLAETPHRISKMYVNEVFSGLDYSEFPRISVIDNKMGADEMVKIRDISLTSTCRSFSDRACTALPIRSVRKNGGSSSV